MNKRVAATVEIKVGRNNYVQEHRMCQPWRRRRVYSLSYERYVERSDDMNEKVQIQGTSNRWVDGGKVTWTKECAFLWYCLLESIVGGLCLGLQCPSSSVLVMKFVGKEGWGLAVPLTETRRKYFRNNLNNESPCSEYCNGYAGVWA